MQIKLFRAQSRKLLRQHLDTLSPAYIDGHRHLGVALHGKMIDQWLQQLGRQVVNTIVCRVLEHIQRDRLARARKAANDYDIHGHEHSGSETNSPASTTSRA